MNYRGEDGKVLEVHYVTKPYNTLCGLDAKKCTVTIISTLVTCTQCKKELKKKGFPLNDKR